jgi:Ran GTPase-activating protein (RanGAP) involved in mRNA processing and transport
MPRKAKAVTDAAKSLPEWLVAAARPAVAVFASGAADTTDAARSLRIRHSGPASFTDEPLAVSGRIETLLYQLDITMRCLTMSDLAMLRAVSPDIRDAVARFPFSGPLLLTNVSTQQLLNPEHRLFGLPFNTAHASLALSELDLPSWNWCAAAMPNTLVAHIPPTQELEVQSMPTLRQRMPHLSVLRISGQLPNTHIYVGGRPGQQKGWHRVVSAGLTSYLFGLRSLHLVYCDIDPTSAAALASVSLQTLSTLELHDCHLGDAGAMALASGLTAACPLTSLRLTNCKIGVAGAQALAIWVAASSPLATLNLNGNPLGDEGVAHVASAVAASDTLTSLGLNLGFGTAGFGDTGATALARGLSSSRSLAFLDWVDLGHSNHQSPISHACKHDLLVEFACCQLRNPSIRRVNWYWPGSFQNAGIARIATELSTNRWLQSFKVPGQFRGMNSPNMVALANALVAQGTVNVLDFSNIYDWEIGQQLNQTAFAALATVIASVRTLTTFLFDFNYIGGASAATLAQGISLSCSLTKLSLAANGIDDVGAAALATVIASVRTLTILNLQHNRIGDAGAVAVAPSVALSGSLTDLDLTSNLIRDDGALALATGLASSRCLTSLRLDDIPKNYRPSEIGPIARAAVHVQLALCEMRQPGVTAVESCGWDLTDAHAALIAVALGVCPTLTSLNLHDNDVGDDGAAALATGLTTTHSLTQLMLSNNHIRTAGARALATAIAHNTTLTALDLDRNQVTDAGALDLVAAIVASNAMRLLCIRVNRLGAACKSSLRSICSAADGRALTVHVDLQSDSE